MLLLLHVVCESALSAFMALLDRVSDLVAVRVDVKPQDIREIEQFLVILAVQESRQRYGIAEALESQALLQRDRIRKQSCRYLYDQHLLEKKLVKVVFQQKLRELYVRDLLVKDSVHVAFYVVFCFFDFRFVYKCFVAQRISLACKGVQHFVHICTAALIEHGLL